MEDLNASGESIDVKIDMKLTSNTDVDRFTDYIFFLTGTDVLVGLSMNEGNVT